MKHVTDATKCPACSGLGKDLSNWDNFPPTCGLCLGQGGISNGRAYELCLMERWYLDNAPKRHQADMARELKDKLDGYVREERFI